MRFRRLPLRRERLEFPDGDFLDLDFLPGSRARSSQPLLLILHGLEGSSQSPHVQSLLAEARQEEIPAVAINYRMCSGEPNRLKTTYHSGKTEDLDFVVNHLLEKGCRELWLAGFSIGGNILLKWLGEQEKRAAGMIKAAAAISVPYDLTQSVSVLDKGWNREVYTRLLVRSLKSKVAAKAKMFPDSVRPERLKKCRTFQEFDREVTAPLNGFRSEREYWEKSSSRNFLSSVRVPTLLIHAEDDPFFPGRFLPRNEIQSSPFLKTLFVPHGGHLGFVAGNLPGNRRPWLEKSVLQFLQNP